MGFFGEKRFRRANEMIDFFPREGAIRHVAWRSQLRAADHDSGVAPAPCCFL